MQVMRYIEETLKKEKMHMTLIDPEKKTPRESAEIALAASRAGTHAIMIGGSTGLTLEIMNETIKMIKSYVSLPVIIFPSGAGVLSPYADALFFMSLLNSNSLEYVVRQQVRGAPIVKKIGIEPIPMGYLVVEPGMTVGRVGQADLLRRDRIEDAVAYALTAQYFGMHLVYLEAGSGAPEPVPPDMIRAVREAIDIPLIVGGGIRTPQQVKKIVNAGADIIVTGTIVEEVENVDLHLGKIIAALSP